MQPRGQFPEPPRTPLGSHLHPVLIPSLRSWRCCLVQSRKQRLSLSPRWEPLPWAGRYRQGWPVPLPATWLELPEPWSQCCLFSIINE